MSIPDLNSLRESILMKEKEEISHKLAIASENNSILLKQVDQWRREHGQLLIEKHEADNELVELRSKFQRLKCDKEEMEPKFWCLFQVVHFLNEKNGQLSEENRDLRAEKAAAEDELWTCRLDCEVLSEKIGEMSRRENGLVEELKEAGKAWKEHTELVTKNKKLERNNDALMAVVTTTYRELQQQLSKMEENMGILRDFSSHSGGKQDGTNDGKIEGLVRSLVSEISSVREKMASYKPSLFKPTSSSSCPIVAICDSDDSDDNIPLIKRLKRKRSIRKCQKRTLPLATVFARK